MSAESGVVTGGFEFRFNNRNNPFIFRDALRELVTAEHIEYRELIG